MQMYNFDFMKNDSPKPIETVHRLAKTLAHAKNYCANLYHTRGAALGADKVQMRENGGSEVKYTWSAND